MCAPRNGRRQRKVEGREGDGREGGGRVEGWVAGPAARKSKRFNRFHDVSLGSLY